MATPEFIRELRKKIGTGSLHVPTVSVFAYDDAQRLLLIRKKELSGWSEPGGIVEPDESPADAAVRETFEETGVLVRITGVLGIFGGPRCNTTYPNGDRITWVATLFAAQAMAGEPRGDDCETSEARYFTAAELAELPCTAHLQMFLDAAQRRPDTPWFQPSSWTPGT
ncbi:MAG: NUDIX domain-containing protein [Burkholderiales bacterium]